MHSLQAHLQVPYPKAKVYALRKAISKSNVISAQSRASWTARSCTIALNTWTSRSQALI